MDELTLARFKTYSEWGTIGGEGENAMAKRKRRRE
jgi:hypothetical protein